MIAEEAQAAYQVQLESHNHLRRAVVLKRIAVERAKAELAMAEVAVTESQLQLNDAFDVYKKSR